MPDDISRTEDDLYRETLKQRTFGKHEEIAIFTRPDGRTHLFVEGGGDFGGVDLSQEELRWVIETLSAFLTT